MSRLIRSRWGLHGVFILVIVVAGGVVMSTPHLVRGQDAGEPGGAAPAVDERLVAEVQALRADIGLSNEDLAILGLSETQAETVMHRLLDWTQQNQGRLDRAAADERLANRSLREAQRSLNVGPRDEQLIRSLPDKSEAANLARQDRRTLQEEAGRQALASVGSEQQQLWALVHSRSDKAQRPPTAYENELIADYRAARSNRPEINDGVLGSPRRAGFKRDHAAHMIGVQAAERRVLPVPAIQAEYLDFPPIDEVDGAGLLPR